MAETTEPLAARSASALGPRVAENFQALARAFRVDQERRGLRAGTIEVRRWCIGSFARWLPDGNLLTADAEAIEAWLDSRRMTPKSRYSALSNIHAFYAFAVRTELLERDPTANIASTPVIVGERESPVNAYPFPLAV